MAFTFLVEDGSGLAAATSYVSVSDCNDILLTNIHFSPSWHSQEHYLSDTKKEYLLSAASRYLDEKTNWNGTKTVETSALRFPRTGIVDRDGFLLVGDAIPQQLKIATAEMARYMMENDRTVARDQDGLASVSVDVIALEYAKGYRLPSVPSHVAYLLKGLGVLSTGRRGTRRIRR